MLRAALIGVLAAILLAACTSGDSSSTPSTATSAPASPAVTETPPSAADSLATSPTTTSTNPPVAAEAIPLVEGYTELELLTPVTGGGTRPLLEWSPVPGTDTYSVVVYDPEGSPYWTTITEETSTYVGGSIQLLEDRPGPRVSVGSSWSVIALDQQQLPLAISGIAPISP